MTLAFSSRSSGPFTATAGQTVFNYGFRIEAATELAVWRRRAGVEMPLAYATDYTVQNVGDAAGGTITLTVGALAGDIYVIDGTKAFARSTAFQGWKSLPPANIETELDELTAEMQELKRDVARALKRAPTQSFGVALPTPDPNMPLGWNDDGTSLANLAALPTGYISASGIGMISVQQFGAVGDGVTDDSDAFEAAAQSAIAKINISTVWQGIAHAPAVTVLVPAADGAYVLTRLLDVGNRHINWVFDTGAIVNDTTKLNGRLIRPGQRLSVYQTHGMIDYAAGYSISVGHPDLERGAAVDGFTTESEVSAYGGRDSVGLFIRAMAPPALFTLSGASYTLTSVMPTTPISADDLKRLRVGMMIDTAHTPTKYTGFITGWAVDGSSIAVEGWYLSLGPGTPATPANGVDAYVSPINKTWAHNANVILQSTSHANQAVGFELGVVNDKAEYEPSSGDWGSPETWGFDAVNIGSYRCGHAYLARRDFYYGYTSWGQAEAAFYVKNSPDQNPQYGLLCTATLGTALIRYQPGGVTHYLVTIAGDVEAGSTAVAGSRFYDFHTSGNNNDWDARIAASGGSAINGAGLFEFRATGGVRTDGDVSPTTNGAAALGTPLLGWSALRGATDFALDIANGDWRAVHASGVLTVDVGDLRVANPGSDPSSLVTLAGAQALIAALVDSSPAALDTLNELAAALGDDPNFATTMTNALAAKAPLASPPLAGTPTAPTAPTTTTTTQIATTAFVQQELAAAPVNYGVGHVLAASGAAATRNSVNDASDANETTLATVTIPGGAMGPNGYVRIWSLWSHTNSGGNKYERIRLNGAAGTLYTQINANNSSATQWVTIIRNRNSQSAQISLGAGAGSPIGETGVGTTTSSIDTSSDVDIVFRCAWEGAVAGEQMTLEAYSVEVFYGA